jgi:hypothetical protein
MITVAVVTMMVTAATTTVAATMTVVATMTVAATMMTAATTMVVVAAKRSHKSVRIRMHAKGLK